MGAKEREIIRAGIRKLGNADAIEIYVGNVESIDENNLTCKVKLNLEVSIPDVRLKATIDGDKGFYVLPKKGSQVIVGELEGGVDYCLLQASEIDKVIFKIGNITFEADKDKIVMNGGNNYGMVKVKELTQKMNAIETKLNNLISLCKAQKVTLAPSGTFDLGGTFFAAIQKINTTQQSDLENDKVQH
jgi:hypothetical protein